MITSQAHVGLRIQTGLSYSSYSFVHHIKLIFIRPRILRSLVKAFPVRTSHKSLFLVSRLIEKLASKLQAIHSLLLRSTTISLYSKMIKF